MDLLVRKACDGRHILFKRKCTEQDISNAKEAIRKAKRYFSESTIGNTLILDVY
jgi:hypothetical protein